MCLQQFRGDLMNWPKLGFLIKSFDFHGHLMGFPTVFDTADFLTGILVEIIAEFRGHLMGWLKLQFQTEF